MEQFLKEHIKAKNVCITASDVTRSPHIELTLVKGDARAFIEGLTPKLVAFRKQNPSSR